MENCGINYFLKCCEKNGIPTDIFCTSQAKKDTKFEKAFVFGNINRIKDNHKYAIKYFPINDLFICWNAHIKKRNNLRLKRDTAIEALEKNEMITQKGIEYPWRKQEDVFVFQTKDIEIFLEFLYE